MYYPSEYFPQNAFERCVLNQELDLILEHLWSNDRLIATQHIRPSDWNKELKNANLYVSKLDVPKFKKAVEELGEQITCNWQFYEVYYP